MIVAIAGEILRMPGLPKEPQALHIDIVDGEIEGLSWYTLKYTLKEHLFWRYADKNKSPSFPIKWMWKDGDDCI